MILKIKATYSVPISKVYAIAVVAAVVWHYFFPIELIDTGEYFRTALNWMSQTQVSDIPLSQLRRSPIYPAFSYLQYPISGTPGLVSLRIIQFFSALYIPVIIREILIHMNLLGQFSKIMIILMTYPLQFYYSALVLPDLLAQLFILIIFNQLLRKKNVGISVAVMIGLKPIFFYLLLLPIVQWMVKHERSLFKTLLPFLFYGGCVFYNDHNYQLPSYTSMGTTNSYYYNRKILLQKIKPERVDSIYDQEGKFILENRFNYQTTDSFMKAKTQESILSNPMIYGMIHIKGMLQTLVDPGRYDAMVFWNWPQISGFMGVNDGNPNKAKRPIYEWIYIFVFGILGLIKAFMFLGSIFLDIKKRSLSISLTLMLIAFAVYIFLLGPVGAARYLLPWYSFISIVIVLNWNYFFKLDIKNENSTVKR